MEIHGHCDARFAALRDAFAQNFAERDEIGASVAVVLEGRPVVDLWAGTLDVARKRPWRQDSLVNVWSLGKAMVSLALLRLIDQGSLDLEDRLIDYWPEFAAAEKDSITFRMALAHRAGLCAVERPLPADAYYHWDLMVEAIAAQRPWWKPDTAHGYHTNTLGFLLGEPIRRITGLGPNAWFQRSIASRLGVDFHMGVPASELARCADLHTPHFGSGARREGAPLPDGGDPLVRMRQLLYTNPDFLSLDPNSRAWRTAEFPSTNPHSNARAVATIFGELAQIHAGKTDGVLSLDLVRRAAEIESDGTDANLERPTRFGLGLQLTQPDRPLGPNPGTFGHYGNGGHVGFADPTARLGFAYHMNRQGTRWRDPRNVALTDALYRSL